MLNKKPVKNKKILLIEDDKFVLDIYNLKLTENGYEVLLAQDGQKALELAREKKPDLILLDIIMPKMDGFEFLESIKKDKDLRDIPVVLLTNVSEDENIKKGLKKGAVSYLIKAFFTPTEIVKEIEKYIK